MCSREHFLAAANKVISAKIASHPDFLPRVLTRMTLMLYPCRLVYSQPDFPFLHEM
jgi:hypothetical protein